MSSTSIDILKIDESCAISYCSVVVILSVIVFILFLMLCVYLIRKKILKGRLSKIQIKTAPQKISSELSIFPKKSELKKESLKKNVKPKKGKVSQRQTLPSNKNKEKEIIPQKPSIKVKNKGNFLTDRTNNQCVNNNFFDDKQVLSENLQVEYFEDKDVGTDMTTIPKERRGLEKNNSGLDFLNFSNNYSEISEKNFENFMKLKNKKRMFHNDDSIEFEDVENLDINHSERGSFKIENKLEIKNDVEEFVYVEPKITRNTENNENENPKVYNRDFTVESVNPYLEEGFIVHELVENLSKSPQKEEGLEVVAEENEEGEKE